MATSSCHLSEEQFLCSICLDPFTLPVTLSCGHNFCMACIRHYWDSNDLCQCPMCMEKFSKRPELRINTLISDMTAQFRKSVQVKATSRPDQRPARSKEVACDVCTGTKLMALKSCLTCLTSYCETHLEPHRVAPALKKHKLIDPVENLEDRMCKQHQSLPELFCRTDQTCICVFCIQTDHKTHDTVPIEEVYGEKMVELRMMMTDIQHTMHTRVQKVEDIKLSAEVTKKNAETAISASVQVFTALMCSIERSQAELIEVIEVKQEAAERRAEGLIKELEQETTELKERSGELRQLSNTEDHLHLLQIFPSLCTTSQKDWSEISVNSDLLCVETLVRAVSKLEDKLNKEMEKLPEVKLKRAQQYAVDVTLDPDTANPFLILSEDGKQVKSGDSIEQNLPENPKRFDVCLEVLAKEGFTSGRFYYEVQVKGKTAWILGVARESVNRKEDVALGPENGFWTVLSNDNDYAAMDKIPVPLSLKQKVQKVGVFVDYDGGEVSFYDVEARSHIYSFTGYTFTEKLYPYFAPGGENSAPLIILCPDKQAN